MKCLCPLCSDQPAPTYTEAWRRECEARYVLRMARQQRQAYYAGVAKFRGREAAQQLVDEVKLQHQQQPGG